MEREELLEYNKKRDFKKTSEPVGEYTHSHDKPIFVIQKHAARRLHYDFRIECEGVLKSWAVPKGPSMDPAEKRLAIQTEDHPMSYADFEGLIPQGEYGGGAVLVWDQGIFENISQKEGKAITIQEAHDKGHISLVMAGQKLKGTFTLIRTSVGRKNQWLFFKSKDPYALPDSNITEEQPNSILTGRTLGQIEAEQRD